MPSSDNSDQSSWGTLLKQKLSQAFAPADARADQAVQEDREAVQSQGENPGQYSQDMKLPLQQRLQKVQKGFLGE